MPEDRDNFQQNAMNPNSEVITRQPFNRLIQPFQNFARQEAASGIVLFTAAVVALIWANSSWGHGYEAVWETHLKVGLGRFVMDEPLEIWINDALMAVFFFVVGLEIKRAMLVGELVSLRRSTLPIVAALGGMVVPAVIYIALNTEGEASRGWGVPMATDIAFSLGVLSLLGSRVPIALKVFLTAVAIIDDIGAVIVIAVFYTGDIEWAALGVGAALLVVLAAINMLGVRSLIVYAFVGVLVWFAFLESGVHATVAGVLVAAIVPIKIRVRTPDFVSRCRDLLALLERSESDRDTIRASQDQKAVLQEFETAVHQMESPLHRFEHLLTPYVAFFIMPLFALANAGVHIQGDFWDALLQPINLGIVAGLVIGKQVGISLSAWASIRWGIAELPFGVSWRHLYGVGILGGIGFTMSLFISNLAFTDGVLGSEAKIGILVGSLISGVIGFLVLRFGPNSTAVDSVVD